MIYRIYIPAYLDVCLLPYSDIHLLPHIPSGVREDLDITLWVDLYLSCINRHLIWFDIYAFSHLIDELFYVELLS